MEALQSKVKAFARLTARVKASRLPSAQPVFKPACDARRAQRCKSRLVLPLRLIGLQLPINRPCASAATPGSRDGVACLHLFKNKLHSRDRCQWIG